TAPRYMQLQSAEARIEGPRAILRQKYRLGHSELVQDIVLTDGSRRIDFVTRLKWRETKSMLRTSFPVNIFSDTAIYEIQFGNISRPTHRNTTWELAKDEVPAQKWADLSQQDYGVALLNDSKYGYKIKDNVIDLNLLRSVPYPGPKLVSDEDVLPGEAHHGYTDQADHEFTYSLFPHPGDHQVGRVAHAAYELNVPLEIRRIEKQKGTLPSQFSFFNVNSPNIIIESVKKAEDDDSVIVRMYQSEKRFEKAQLKSGFPVENAVEVNLIEQSIKPLDPINESILELEFEPFEIKSVKLVFKREHSLAN
ncbi:MAG TPA: alpha-mannosidase, partial [bacterium]|nr:alpha-mannosidase [bacterium]